MRVPLEVSVILCVACPLLHDQGPAVLDVKITEPGVQKVVGPLGVITGIVPAVTLMVIELHAAIPSTLTE